MDKDLRKPKVMHQSIPAVPIFKAVRGLEARLTMRRRSPLKKEQEELFRAFWKSGGQGLLPEDFATMVDEPSLKKEQDELIRLFQSKQRRVRPFSVTSWTQRECLGTGHFGKVYKCVTSDDDIFAVKIVKVEPQHTETQKEVETLNNEMGIMRRLSHERIMSYYGSQQKDGYLYLFMDFMAGGSLSAYIRIRGVLCEDESQRYTNQMLQGIEFLHSENVIHRDIKGSNVLLDGKGNVKLADFGLSRMIEKVGTRTTLVSHCGTPYWMAPEIFWGEGYGRKADIWSLGCTVVEMLTGKPPLGNLEPAAAIFSIGSKPTKPTLPEAVSQDARDFIMAALTWNPDERPWSHDLQRYKFVSKSVQPMSAAASVSSDWL